MQGLRFSSRWALVLFFAAWAGGGLSAQFGGIPPLPPPIFPPIDPPVIELPPGTTVRFDNLSVGTVVSRQYQALGVIFDGSPRIVPAAPVSTASNPNALEAPYGGDIPDHDGPLSMRFTSPVRKVSVKVGDRYAGGFDDHAILRAYDAAGRLVARTSTFLGSALRNITLPLDIDAGSNRIVRIQVHFAWETSLDGVVIDVDRGGVEVIDNLYFEGEEPPPPPPDEPPVVRIVRPSHLSTHFGDNLLRFEGTIQDDIGLGSVTLRQEFLDSTDAPIEAPLSWAGRAPSFTFPQFPSVFRLGLRPGRNRLIVTAVDSAGQSHRAEVTVLFGAPPVVEISAPSDGDSTDETSIVVRGRIRKELGSLRRDNVTVEVSNSAGTVLSPRRVDSLSGRAPEYTFTATVPLGDQGARTLNTIRVKARDEGGAEDIDSVRVVVDRPDRIGTFLVATQAIEGGVLVVGRRTVVRATPYQLVTGNYLNVRAELSGFRDGVELPGSPLSPFGTPTIDIRSGLSYADRHGNASRTWNFLLPASWTDVAGEVEVVASVDPDNDIEECVTCQENNWEELTLRFLESETLRVRPVRMTGIYSDGMERTPSEADALSSMEAVRRIMPYASLEILPVRTLRTRPLHNPFSDDGMDDALDDLYDSFTCYDSTNVLGWLEDTFTGCRWSSYTIGLFAGGPNMAGNPALPGGLAYVPSPGGVAEATPWVAAHELAHAIGRKHAGNGHGESDGGGHDGRFPNPHGTVGNDYGFDTTDWVAIRPSYDTVASIPPFLRRSARECDPTAGACQTHDYLSYGRNPFWTSAYTWNAIHRAGFGGSRGGIGGGRAVPDEAAGGGAGLLTERVVHVRGRIRADGSFVARPFYTLPTPEGFVSGEGDGPLEAIAVRADGKPLAMRRTMPVAAGDSDSLRLSFLLPLPENTSWIELYYEGQLMEQRSISANAPEVTVLLPTAGESVAADGILTVRWEAFDADGDTLTYGVQYSPDAGGTWGTLVNDLVDSEFQIAAADVPGSEKALVRVVATDGVLAGRGVSAPFRVEGKAPQSIILWPRDGQELPAGNILVFESSVSDHEDESVSDDSIRWISDVDGVIGRGRRADVYKLSRGRHVIRLEAEDSDGQRSTDEVEIYVGTTAPTTTFIRGDVSGEGVVGIADPVQLLNHLFLGGKAPKCRDAADADDNGQLALTDGIYILNFLFLGGPEPKAPFPLEGVDPTDDALDCGVLD